MSAPPLRIGVVVGEASGDLLGAGLMKAILQRFPEATFEGIGGPKMLELGFTSFHAQERLAVMGLIEPLKRLFELLRIRRHLIDHFSNNPPDLFIGIDSPDFNLTIEERLKQKGIKTVHYVSPSVWAWRQGRIHKIRRAVDKVLTFLPFEAGFYRQHHVPVAFVGHPLADEIPLQNDKEKARERLAVASEDLCIALMPGSRGGEVALLGPIFWQAAALCHRRYPQLKFLVPAANSVRFEQISQQLAELPTPLPIQLVEGRSHDVLEACDLVLMASGTTTLEAMLFKKPMVVAYRFSRLGYWILSRIVKTPYVSLPNLLADDALVPELIQNDATPERLAGELTTYLESPVRVRDLKRRFTELHEQIRCQANERAAEAVLSMIGRGQ